MPRDGCRRCSNGFVNYLDERYVSYEGKQSTRSIEYTISKISFVICISIPLSNSFHTDLLLSGRRFFEPPQGTVLPPLEEFNLDDGTHYQRR